MPYRGRSLPKPGETEGKLFTSTGFSDYLYYSEMLHIIAHSALEHPPSRSARRVCRQLEKMQARM